MKYYNFLTKPHAQFWLKIYASIIFLYSLSGYLLKAFPHNTTANILLLDRNTVVDEINISPATKVINFK